MKKIVLILLLLSLSLMELSAINNDKSFSFIIGHPNKSFFFEFGNRRCSDLFRRKIISLEKNNIKIQFKYIKNILDEKNFYSLIIADKKKLYKISIPNEILNRKGIVINDRFVILPIFGIVKKQYTKIDKTYIPIITKDKKIINIIIYNKFSNKAFNI